MDTRWTNDVIGSLPSLLHCASEQELRQLEMDLAAASPAAFAQIASEGRWLPARHLAYLERAILESIDQAAAGRLEGLVVSMPPQHGKSELCSRFLPAWYLGTSPPYAYQLLWAGALPADPAGRRQCRVARVLRLACCCGLRASEIGELRLQDVVVGVERPHLRIGATGAKGGRRRTVPLWWDAGTLAEVRDAAGHASGHTTSVRSEEHTSELQSH